MEVISEKSPAQKIPTPFERSVPDTDGPTLSVHCGKWRVSPNRGHSPAQMLAARAVDFGNWGGFRMAGRQAEGTDRHKRNFHCLWGESSLLYF